MTEKKRINFYMQPYLVDKVDELAQMYGLDRSGAFSYIVGHYFQQAEQMSTAAKMVELLNSPEMQTLMAAQIGAIKDGACDAE